MSTWDRLLTKQTSRNKEIRHTFYNDQTRSCPCRYVDQASIVSNREDTFDLQSNVDIGGPLHTRHSELGFDGLGDEEEEMYEEDNDDDDDDGDALSSSPSIPDDVSLPSTHEPPADRQY